MAESSGENYKSTKWQCSICLEGFKLPKLLPCFHSFCKSCLQTYVESNSDDNRNFNCPLCRCTIHLPENGVDGLQSNFYIVTKEIESKESGISIVCDICDSEEAVSRCIECNENMCQNCTKSHSKMKLARGHHVANLGDTELRVKPKTYCRKHENEEIRFVCKKCDELICINCKLTLHENHTTRDVEDEAKQFREELSNLLNSEKCTTHVSKMEINLTKLEENCREVKEKESTEFQKIMDHAAHVKRQVDIDSDGLCKKVKLKASDADKVITKIRESIKMNIESYSSLCSSANHILEMASDADTIKYGNNLRKRLEDELEGQKKDLMMDITINIEFIPDQMLTKDNRNLVGTMVTPFTKKEEKPISILPKVNKVKSYSFGSASDLISVAVDDENVWIIISRFSYRQRRKTFIARIDCSNIQEEVRIDGQCCDNLCTTGDDKIYFTSESSVEHISSEDIEDDPITFLEFGRPFSTQYLSCLDLTTTGESGKYGQRFIRGLTYDPNSDELLLSVCSAPSYESYKSLNFAEKIPGQLIWYKRDGTVKKKQFPKWNTHLKYPTKVALNANGDICLLDNGGPSCCLYIFGSEGELKSKFIPKSNTGCGLVPSGVCCDKNSFIFLCYIGSKRIDILDKNGMHIKEFESTFQPSELHVDQKNRLWVCGKRGRLDMWKICY